MSDQRALYSNDIEQSILGSILLDSSDLDKISGLLQPEDFYRDQHRQIYESALRLADRNEPVDMMTISNDLEKLGKKSTRVIEYLADLIDITPTAGNVCVFAEIVADKANLRRTITKMEEILAIARGEGMTAREVQTEAEEIVFQMSQGRDDSRELRMAGEVVKSAHRRIERRVAGDIENLMTGYSDLDNLTGGMAPGELVVVAARTSVGKSAFASNVIDNLHERDSKVVTVIFSLEMDAEEIASRQIAGLGKVDAAYLRDARRFRLQGEKGMSNLWAKINDGCGKIHKRLGYYDDTPAQTVGNIRAKCRRIFAKHKRLDFVVIDYLQLMKSNLRNEGRPAQIAEITGNLKSFARELRCPLMVLSQLNRDAVKKHGKGNSDPELHENKGSGSIEEDADQAWLLHRPDKDNGTGMDVARVFVKKNRNGSTGKVKLNFEKRFVRFYDHVDEAVYADEEQEVLL